MKEQLNEWRKQVKEIFRLYSLTDEQIDYHFLSSPNTAKRVLTDEQFSEYLESIERFLLRSKL